MGIKHLDVIPELQQVHNQALQRRLARTNWHSGCTSWYLTASGHNATLSPGFATQCARPLARMDLADYRVVV